MRICILTNADSRLRWSAAVALQNTRRDHIDVLSVGDKLQATDIARAGLDPNPELLGHTNLRAQELARELQCDVAIVMLGGNENRDCLDAFLAQTRRPFLLTGYEGIVYEHELQGLNNRLGADLICVNSTKDLTTFASSKALLDSGSSLVVSGYPRRQTVQRPATSGARRTVIFAPQTLVPGEYADRARLLLLLTQFANRNPGLNLLIKERSDPSRESEEPHADHRRHDCRRWRFEDLLERLAGARVLSIPDNLNFAYGPMDAYLSEARLLLTVSSTAALDAFRRGVPAGIISDFGIRETWGNHFFVGSGAFVSLVDLAEDTQPHFRDDWLEYNGFLTESKVDLGRFLKLVPDRDQSTTAAIRRPELPAEILKKLQAHYMEDRETVSRSFNYKLGQLILHLPRLLWRWCQAGVTNSSK